MGAMFLVAVSSEKHYFNVWWGVLKGDWYPELTAKKRSESVKVLKIKGIFGKFY